MLGKRLHYASLAQDYVVRVDPPRTMQEDRARAIPSGHFAFEQCKRIVAGGRDHAVRVARELEHVVSAQARVGGDATIRPVTQDVGLAFW